MTGRTAEPEERLLIEAAQQDPGRFGELYERNFDRVYAFVARRLRDRSEAEDVTAEVFHRALASLSRFEWRGAPFASWLFRIAANSIASRFERAARERQAASNPLPDSAAASVADAGLEEVEERAELARLVRELPPDQRRVVAMRFAEEKSIREIAQEIGRSEGAVKQLQFRALENLRARVGRQDG